MSINVFLSGRKFTTVVLKNERPAIIALIVINVSPRRHEPVIFFMRVFMAFRSSRPRFNDNDAYRANVRFLCTEIIT